MARKTLTSLAVFVLLEASFTQAAPIVTISDQGFFPSGNQYFVFNVNPNGFTYDLIDVTFSVAEPNTLLLGENNPFIVEFTPAGTTENTDVLGLNTIALGWSILGGTDSPTLFQASGGPLGEDITEPVDFAQLVTTPCPNVVVEFSFSHEQVLVDFQLFLIICPEPASFALALAGLCFSGRRRC